MASAILTDGATFTCKHGGSGTVASGLSISALADVFIIGGHKAILAGATISGFTVPALVTHRADTQVELKSGQSFAISGLLDNRTIDQMEKIP